jgi:hypothetical protein
LKQAKNIGFRSEEKWAGQTSTGGGKIMIDRKSVPEYLKLVDTVLDENTFTVIDFARPISKDLMK